MGIQIGPSIALTRTMEQVEGRFTSSQEYANEAFQAAKDYLQQMEEVIESYNPEFIDLTYETPTIGVGAYDPVHPTRPDLSVEFPDANFLDTYELQDVSVEGVGGMPEFTESDPSLDIPDAPDIEWPASPGEPPAINTATEIPGADRYNQELPDPPDIDDIEYYTEGPPDVSIPDFDKRMPIKDFGDPPVNTFIYNPETYQSALKDAVYAKLKEDVVNGGTGLGASIEAAIFQRARDRSREANEAKYDEALNFWAARGWSMPTGALNGWLQRIQIEIANAEEEANYEILIEQARLAQNNTQFAVSTGLDMEKLLMGHFNEGVQREFEAAKYKFDAGVMAYEAGVKGYMAEVDAYKSYAGAYESRVRAEVEKLNVWKARIEASRLQVEIKELAVRLYESRLRAVETLKNLYISELEASRLKLSIEEMKLSAHKTKVEVFAATVRGLTERYSGYQAELSAELKKVDIYKAKVDAYRGKIEGKRTEADIRLAEMRANLENERLKIEELRIKLDKYNGDTQTALAELEAKTRAYGADVDMYKADVSHAGVKTKAEIDAAEARYRAANLEKEIMFREADANLEEQARRQQMAVESIMAASRVSAQLAASIYSSVSAAASVRYNASTSSNKSESSSISETHRYDEKCCD